MSQLRFALLVSIASATACGGQPSAGEVAASVSEASLEAHLRLLAHDELEGRAPGTRGERPSALYIATQFRRLGLEPAGDAGTFYQRFPLLGYRPTVVAGWSGETLRTGSDFVALSPAGEPAVDLRVEAIFAGYGVTASHYGRDDYGESDVTGRLVVAFAGGPLAVDSSGTLGTSYGEAVYKRDEARRRGAAGLLLVSHPVRAPASWEETVLDYQDLVWLAPDVGDPLRVTGWLNPERLADLASGAGTSLYQLMADAESAEFQPVSLGEVELRVMGRVAQRIEAMNVAACLPGRDRDDQEVVVLGGHYDHLGIGPAVAGDSIHNGALDNASGTATLLAVAEAIATAGVRPERSICFLAFGAEERGLLGSQVYVAREPDPSRIVAMLNIDGANIWGETRDIAVLGDDQSTLGDNFRRAVADEGLTVTVHPSEVRGRFFFRSDHLSFARAGVPSLFLRRGKALTDPGDFPWDERYREYYDSRYHQPADEVLPWNSAVGAAQQARVLVRVLLDVANSPERPTWAEGSEFRDR